MRKVSKEEREKLSRETPAQEVEDLLEQLKGFSQVSLKALKSLVSRTTLSFFQVIQRLSDQKKVLVGHNCLGDFMRLYQQFVDDLPLGY